jgi:hypothetical protein
VRRAASLLIWFALLEGLWAMLVGTQQDTELAAGLPVAAIGAVFAEILRTKGLLSFATDFRLLGKAWKLVWLVPFDFLLVTWILGRALASGRRVQGQWVRVPFSTDDGSLGNWQRAFAVAMSNNAANALVVDFEDGEALLHALAPDLVSARSVL